MSWKRIIERYDPFDYVILVDGSH